VRYQLRHAPGLRGKCSRTTLSPCGRWEGCTTAAAFTGPPSGAALFHTIAPVGLAALFTVLTAGFAALAVWTAAAGQWPIGLAAAALALWMATLAAGALRKLRS
jgi:hypothetical protein